MRWPAKRIAKSSGKSFGMYEEAAVLTQQGVDVIHLEVGRPSFDTPSHIKEGAKAALDSGLVHYGDFAGNSGFREVIAAKLRDRNGISVQADEVLVTNGLTHAAFVTCMAAIDPGDEVLVLEPAYPQHIGKIELAGGIPVPVPLDPRNGFSIDEQAIRDRISPRTRMLSLVNPCNPTGRVYSLEELSILAGLACEFDLLVMSDEVYEQIVYDGRRHISIATLPGMPDRTITHFAFTKAYAMDGWRLGYLAAPRHYMQALLAVSSTDVAHVNVFVQEGGRAALEGDQQCLLDMLAEDCRRRDLACRRLNAMPGITCPVPEGTIYAFPKVTGMGMTSARLAHGILRETHVAVEAGDFYGRSGEGHLRVCFGSEPYDRLELAMDRLDRFFCQASKSDVRHG